MKASLNELLKMSIQDETIIFPTDTVYGVGAKVDSVKGIENIYNLKHRDKNKPLAILCANIKQVETLVITNDETLKKCNAFWPGAYTFLFKKKATLNPLISNNTKVGIRIPKSEIALQILEKFGPMATTSVNISGETPATSLLEVIDFKADIIVTDKAKMDQVSSNVFDLETRTLLRKGKGYKALIEAFTK